MSLFDEKWKPVFGPDMETGSAEPDTGDAPPPEVDTPDEPSQTEGPGSGRSEIRKSLEKGFAKAREADEEEQTTPDRDRRSGQFRKGDRVGNRLAKMQDSGPAQPEAETDEEVIPEVNPPEGWSADAKQLWNEVPDAVQAAVLKRESDVSKGVKALQDRYSELDKALEPHLQDIRAHGKTPGQAVEQLFAWFSALRNNPYQSFHALARSFGYDLRQFVPQQQPQQQRPAQPQTNGQAAPAGQPGDDAARGAAAQRQQQYNAWLQQNFGNLYQQQQYLQRQLEYQNQQKTEEALSFWAKDKPYYEDVRERMAYLIGSGAVPSKDGKVDLDAAYEQAVWSLPDVRNRIQQEQAAKARAEAKTKKEAEAKAQAAQAEKARRAAVSMPLNAPGVPNLKNNGQSKVRGKSVKETLMEAVAQHRPE